MSGRLNVEVTLSLDGNACWATDLENFIERARALDEIPYDFLVEIKTFDDIELRADSDFRHRGRDE